MNWRKIVSVISAVGCLTLAGCSIFASHPVKDAANQVKDSIGSVAGIHFGVLDVIAGLAALGAAASLVAWGFGLVVPPKVTISLVVTTVAAWTLKVILTQFLWIIAVLSVIALILTGAVFAYTHIGWLETKLNKDLNKNGKIGG